MDLKGLTNIELFVLVVEAKATGDEKLLDDIKDELEKRKGDSKEV